MDISIIIPLHKPNKKLLEKIEKTLKKQDYPGKINLIKVDKGLGLAESLNYGIKKAKTDIVVSLHQDCIPFSDKWLQKLVNPLKNKGIVASVSKVELPLKFWKEFDLFAKIMSAKEQKLITPLIDEKGCAYKKTALIKTGLFDGKNFRTAGEDFDMWIKLNKIGKISYPNCRVLHYHKHTFKNRIKKEFQLSNGFGALVRIYKKDMPKWWLGILKSLPIIGWPLFLVGFPYFKAGFKSILWIPLSLLINFIYSAGFWKGFLMKKQTI
ncbi:MAG: glycosyltransferase [Nanoarchaeota archaeon]|nr:glycosyltransferase [Nanoarchaeota archaeon]